MCNEIENKSNDFVDDNDLLKKYGDNTNREFKDSLFKIVFGEHPENALSLYNAVNNTRYNNVEDLSIKILRDAMYIGIRNDVSFLFNHELCLYEHQSSLCGNMPMRGLEYLVDLIKINLSSRGITRRMLFSTSTIPLPTPKYYVFYNGPDRNFERREMHLSDAYKGAGDIEVTAHIINVNVGHNKEMMGISKPLADYAEVIHRIQENTEMGTYKSREEAVAAAIESCIADNILADVLTEERDRVMLTMIGGPTAEELRGALEFDREVALKLAEESEKRAEEAEKTKAEIIGMIDYLIEHQRYEDLARASKDDEFRKTILEEMCKE